jgi:putative glutamine amidotransferase
MKTKEEQVVIGITCGRKENEAHFYLSQAYVKAVQEASGLPVILPGCTGQKEMTGLLRLIQGLILSGGGDVDPVYFSEEPLPGLGEIDPARDIFELNFTRLALTAGIPVLGICRGMQVLNIAFGGSVYQDMFTQVKERPVSRLGTQADQGKSDFLPGHQVLSEASCLEHYQKAPRRYPTHKVKIAAGTILARIFGVTELRVNSFHHQAVHQLAPGFIVSALAVDGIIEGIESINHSFVLGLQWHPENLEEHRVLFRALIKACKKEPVK